MGADHPLAFLEGTWSGLGRGDYPTVAPFTYRERLTFRGGPVLHYEQHTTHPDTGEPMHREAGYLRPAGDGRVEWVIAQPTGVVEVDEGTLAGTTLRVASRLVGTTSTAKRVDTVERALSVEGDLLRYRLLMGAVGQPHLLHLEAELRREP